MKQIIFLVLIVAAGYKGWEYFQTPSIEPLYEQPYLVVYGRDSCGFTSKMRKELSQAGVKFKYMSVDDKAVADSIHLRMDASGIDIGYYLLPVVDLNNSISVRPDSGQLIDDAKALSL